jgi:hypothetical protein
MSYPDMHAVDELVHGAYASEGFIVTDRAGEEHIDDDRLMDAVYHVLLDHVVADASEMTERAITQHELYEAIFPHGPGARRQPDSEEETLARERVARKVWGYANTGITGHCNKRVEAEGYTFVMCEADVARTYRSDETGRPKPTTETGRFFTDDPDLITMHSTLPRVHKVTKAAEAVAKHLTMAVRRHPEIAPAVARQAAIALKQTHATLGPVADAKVATALTSAKPEDEVA